MTDKEEPSAEEQARLAEMIAIAAQNDVFRKSPTCNEASGRWIYTAAINEQGPSFLADCVKVVGEYIDFTEDNNPYGTLEMGFMKIQEKLSSGRLISLINPTTWGHRTPPFWSGRAAF